MPEKNKLNTNMPQTKKPDFFDLARQKVLLLDGAMGTQIQNMDPCAGDFGGPELDGCNELLSVTRPDWIRKIHADYLDAGADGIETNTFGATPHVLAEYGIASRAYEINRVSAELAREVCVSYDRPAYVVGSIGPGTKLVTLGQIPYDTMLSSYKTQVEGLIDGGADVLLVETSQDIQQIKIAVRACVEVMRKKNVSLPVMAQVTVELTGTLLVGTDVQAALTVLEMFPVGCLGLNCATGPDEMRSHLQYLSETAPFLLSCLPNAGLPENVKGRTVYPLGPKIFAEKVAELVRAFGVNIVGGCCGTTPEHIRALASELGGRRLSPRTPRYDNAVASLYSSVPVDLEPKPLFVGERTNANGSKLFRDKLAADDFDALVQIAKGQLKEGAHVLDCCTAFVSRDEVRDMTEFLSRVVTQVNIPIMVDSTEVPVMEASLKIVPGKAIVNSINLEDGEKRAREVLALCRTYGAAVVALTIDEEGMAKTRTKKLAIARRLYAMAHGEFGLKPSDIIFDPLTFTLGSGDEEFRKSAIETLEAIRLIKKELPGVKTILGLSNVSFGLNPWPRRLLNSVMLYHGVEHGLDMAISNASKIMPLFKMAEDERKLFDDLIFDRRAENYDPLKLILARYSDKKAVARDIAATKSLPLPERLANHIIDGEKIEVVSTLKEALQAGHRPLDIINNFLLSGMKVVGEKFGAGEMQLPFVLESAEAMKAAVAYLEPMMDRSETGAKKGRIILATVKGDVHDIGKNLVDIILSNNGFDVINLGIKQSIETILEKYVEIKPDAIGLSGLLVKSTVIMRSDLEEMNHRQLDVPVILGGAALTRKYVEEDCQAVYRGKVFYAEDAFEGLRLMGMIATAQSPEALAEAVRASAAAAQKTPAKSTDSEGNFFGKADDGAAGESGAPRVRAVKRGASATELTATGQSTWVKRLKSAPEPPFWGSKIIEARPAEVFAWLDEFALVRTRWQFAKGELSDEAFKAVLEEKARPLLNSWKTRIEKEGLLAPAAIYGYYSCNSHGNKLLIYESPESSALLAEFEFPRQGSGRSLCLSDFFTPIDNSLQNVIPMQIVTMGAVASEFTAQLYAKNQYSDYFYFHGLSTEMAEAFAEMLHAKIRRELGIHQRDARNMRQLFSQGYQGSRYSFGYPACPHLEDNRILFACLKPERIGVTLTESCQMVPEQSTCAIVAWHPQARYFSI